MKLFEDTPINAAKDILTKAKIFGVQAKLHDIERQYIRAREEAQLMLMRQLGHHLAEQLENFTLALIKEHNYPEEFSTVYRSEVVIFTRDEYDQLVSAIDTLDRLEQFKTLDFSTKLGV